MHDYFIRIIKGLSKDIGYKFIRHDDKIVIILPKDIENPNQTFIDPYPDEIYVEIIDHFNRTVGTGYKTGAEATRRMIRGRLEEGFSAEDIKAVITDKSKEWLESATMVKYLRPTTLFAKTKFEGYLNAIEKNPCADAYDLLKDDWNE